MNSVDILFEEYQSLIKRNLERQNNSTQGSLFSNVKPEQIVENLGGLDTVVELYLLHNKDFCEKNLSQESIESLTRLFSSLLKDDVDDTNDGIDDDDEKHESLIELPVTHKQTNLTRIISDPHSDQLENINDNNSYSNTNVNTINIYSNHKTIFAVNGKNNMYFKYFPENIANYMYYTILLNKWIALATITFAIMLVILPSLVSYVDNEATFDYNETIRVVWFTSRIICIILCIIYGLSMNISLLKIIFQSFDFIFKMYNLFIYLIANFSIAIIDFNNSARFDQDIEIGLGGKIAMRIVYSVTLLSIMPLIFTLDAIYLPVKLKLFGLLCLTLLLAAELFNAFFIIDESDFNWNPLGAKYSNINFKQTLISSLFNLIIFTVKPVGAIFLRKLMWYKKNNCNQDTSDNNGGGENDVQRSTTAYKKPYFKWCNISYSSMLTDTQ